MSIGITGQTIAYMDVSARTKNTQSRDNDGFNKAAIKTNESSLTYRLPGKEYGKLESVVDEFKKKLPDQSGHVDKQVSLGKKARAIYGMSEVNTEEMTMEEYKSYISDILDKIPFDATRPYDEEVIYISDEGWEQMKKDPDYEAWVLEYNVENRSVKNPFFGLGDKGSYGIEHFGASIEEHHGEGYSKVYGGTARGARSMFESAASGKGAIRKNAPRSGEQPPEDWSIEEEQRKAKRKKKDFWDEIFETQLEYRAELKERLNREYYNRALSEKKMMSGQIFTKTAING